jgi:hypothetical protein
MVVIDAMPALARLNASRATPMLFMFLSTKALPGEKRDSQKIVPVRTMRRKMGSQFIVVSLAHGAALCSLRALA